ncbi:MAG: hypothetical protein GF317_05960 [Candidatus Lokiarchaeota archaeon]|nr:hypothetical protein [Candidatus Lokiarchaeota archaeon]
MVLSTYALGTIFEYIIKRYFYKKERCLTFRCSGSKPFDLLVLKKGPIYIHLVDKKKDLKELPFELYDEGYFIIRQAGHSETEYIAIKNKVVIILQWIKKADLRVLREISELKIEVNWIESIEDFLSIEELERCTRMEVIECKVIGETKSEPYINKKQLNKLRRIVDNTGGTLGIASIHQRTLFDYGAEIIYLLSEETTYGIEINNVYI